MGSETQQLGKKNMFETAVRFLEKDNDEHDKFGAHIAVKLRRMDENRCLFAENVINIVLLKGQLKQLAEFSTVFTLPSDILSQINVSINQLYRSASSVYTGHSSVSNPSIHQSYYSPPSNQ